MINAMQKINSDADRQRQTVMIEITPKPKLTIRIPEDLDDDNAKLVRPKKEITVLKKNCPSVNAVTGLITTASICTMIFLAYLEPKTLVASLPLAICYCINSYQIPEE